MDKVLTKEDILSADDSKRERVSVPEWGGDVFVGVMSGTDRDDFELRVANSLVDKKGEPDYDRWRKFNAKARLVAYTAMDEAGNRLFELADVEALAQKSGKALARVAEVASRLNGISDEGAEEAKKG